LQIAAAATAMLWSWTHVEPACIPAAKKENGMNQRLVSNYGSVVVATAFASAVLTAFGPDVAEAAPAPHHVAQNGAHIELGRVTAIHAITQQAQPSGAGAVLGGVAGGLLGNQIGHGTGRAAATVAGAAGGALVGNSIEKGRSSKVTGYRVTVRTDGGHTRVFEADHLDGLKVGDRVRVDGGLLRRA